MECPVLVVANKAMKIDIKEAIARNDKPTLEVRYVVLTVDNKIWQWVAGYVARGPGVEAVAEVVREFHHANSRFWLT